MKDRVEKESKKKNASKNTFRLVAEEYMKIKLQIGLKKYKQQMRDSFERDVYRRLLVIKLRKDVTSHDVLKIMENTLQARSKPK